MLLCLLISVVSMWFWWLNFSVIDNFISVADVAAVYFITLYQQTCILFWFHLFTLNHNYLTVFYMIFVLVMIIHLVLYIFICFIFFVSSNIFILWNILLIIVTSYCILYFIYLYILVHMTLKYFDILSHILYWIVIIYRKSSKKNSLYQNICIDNMESVCWRKFILCFVLVTSTPKWL